MNARIIIRNLQRNKPFTLLNITGLGVGLACVTLIALWVYNESYFDRFNDKYERIYQINFKYSDGNIMVGSPNPLCPLLPDLVSGIDQAARIRNAPGFAFRYNDKMFFEENGITADPSIFDIFSIKTISGDPRKALDCVEAIVITRSFATRYFGNENPLEKEIQIEGDQYLPVLAVIEDVPEQSHLQFDYILPHKLAEENLFCGLEWGDPNFRTYILINPSCLYSDIENNITQVALENGMPHVKYDEAIVSLRPLKEIYLDYSLDNRLGKTGDYRNLYIFSSIALLILVLACINFINLSVSMFARKQSNSAIRNMCGANRTNIFLNHIIENGVMVMFSFIFSMILVSLSVPKFENFLDVSLKGTYSDPHFFLLVFMIFCTTAIICSIYPSMLFSSKRAIEFIKRKNSHKKGGFSFMIVVQNIIAATLIIMALGVNSQIKFMRTKSLGFDTEKIVYTYLRGNINRKIPTIKKLLLDNPYISDVCLKDCLPYDQRNGTVGIGWLKDGEWINDNEGKQVGVETTRIDDRYFNMMNVKIISGRNFSNTIAEDKHNYIVNETAVKAMQLEEPVGTEFHLYGEKGQIVGVIKDTYFKSLHEEIKPQVFHLYDDEIEETYFSALLIKTTGNTKAAVKAIESVWKENNSGIPFEYHFLDEDYEGLYKKYTNLSIMLNSFSLLAIFIACLGLFGQTFISNENRIKEIGIRKVNGAKIHEVILLLNQNVVVRIGIAYLFSAPMSFFAIRKWLYNFAYKTEINIGLFILAAIFILVISLFTASWQSWQTARRNPVEALRNE